MSTALKRPKQPELVRTTIVSATLDLLVDEGLQAITLDSVARQAGVSKGGLQHHFRSKAALIDGLFEFLCAEFETQFTELLAQEDNKPGKHARAYIRASFLPIDPRRQKAIGLLTLNWPGCGKYWREWMTAELAKDQQDCPAFAQQLLTARLAADGFWCSQMMDMYSLDNTQQSTLLGSLLALCEGPLS